MTGDRRIWFERAFAGGLGPEALPDLVERLRGTPLRLEERVAGLAPDDLTARRDGGWSIQENVGHLVDLEALWWARAEDFDAGRETLAAADLDNRATHDARHNDGPLDALLDAFRTRRAALVSWFENQDERAAARVARHPRLDQPMTVADLAFFVAEHDDHHLARITAIRKGALSHK